MKSHVLLAGLLSATVAAAAERPNLIFILADDLGHADLGSYGQQLIRTPRLDRMATEGMRFTQHYSGSASCAPARSALMTGLHTGQTRIRLNGDKPLQPADVTLAELLQRAGYATGGLGKWGLGLEHTTGAPWKKGFDEFLGFLDQTHAHSHYPDHVWHNDRRVEIPENRDRARGRFAQDLFIDGALGFIRRRHARPFFLYLPLTASHAELLAPEAAVAEYRGRWSEPKQFPGTKTYSPQPQPRAVRAATITRLDRDVGRVLDLLDELKIAGRTLVLFSGDNGPATAGGHDPVFFGSAGALRGLKFSLYEGGIRVPLIALAGPRAPRHDIGSCVGLLGCPADRRRAGRGQGAVQPRRDFVHPDAAGRLRSPAPARIPLLGARTRAGAAVWAMEGRAPRPWRPDPALRSHRRSRGGARCGGAARRRGAGRRAAHGSRSHRFARLPAAASLQKK